MCYDENDQVPLAPSDESPVSGTELELSTSDGNRFPAYLANPERPTGPPIVLLPDAGGLDPFYRELARRFAGLGQPTLAIDYYGRTAESPERDGDFDHQAHLKQLLRETMLLDVRTGVDHSPPLPMRPPSSSASAWAAPPRCWPVQPTSESPV